MDITWHLLLLLPVIRVISSLIVIILKGLRVKAIRIISVLRVRLVFVVIAPLSSTIVSIITLRSEAVLLAIFIHITIVI